VGIEVSMIEGRGLTKSYREGGIERLILAGADIHVARGEFAALVGPSGCGKSTLLNLLSGIDVPTSGEVFIDSVCLTMLSEKERTLFRRKNIGFVFQFFNLIPTLNVEENLMLPLSLNGIAEGRSRSRVKMLLEAVGLADRSKAYPDRLSGGEQQRAAIARALAHDPSLILADEPTGNLDADTGHHVMELLAALVRDEGRTLLVVTHSAEIAGMADSVYEMSEGILVSRSLRSAD
jgi:putative ABC transport system ATP-binding protein